MTNDELTQHMRELLAERIKNTLTRGSAETASLILQGKDGIVLPIEATDAMIAARNEALEEAAKLYESWRPETDPELQEMIRALKVQS